MSSKWQKLQKTAFIFFILVTICSVILYYFIRDDFSLSEFRTLINDFGVWAPIVFIALYAIGTVFIPSTPFMAIAGVLFGFKFGLLYTIIGGILSAAIVFAISRKLGKTWVESILEKDYLKKIDDYNKRLEKGAIADLAILRMIPIMPFNVLNIMMGISRINLRDYIIGTLLGLIPSNVATVYFGTFLTVLF